MMGGLNVFHLMNQRFLSKLDELRELVDEPLTINSSYRTKAYNESIGGSSRSKHIEGIAVDIACDNATLRAKIVKKALSLGLTVGPAKTFVHVDNRDNQILFVY